MPEYENDEVQVPNPDGEVAFTVGDEDRATVVTVAADGPLDAGSDKSQDEHEEYSHRVKKRLDKMTAKLREAERREQAALEYARNVHSQLEQTQARVSTLDTNYITESRGRIDSQMAIVEANLQDAIERGDGKAATEAQKLLAQLVSQQDRLNREVEERKVRQISSQPVPRPEAVIQRQQPVADPKAEKWAEENEWFGQDKPMTFAAFGIHNQLEEEGFDLSSNEYYDELNRRIRKEFPHKFKRQENNAVYAPAVAPATRSTSTGTSGRSRSVKLTPSEVSIARRLNVPLEEYAKYVRR